MTIVKQPGLSAASKRVIVVLAALLTIASCSRSEAIDASSPIFAGLDSSVAAEVLADPIYGARIQEQPEESRAELAQNIVRNFMMCREFLTAYQQWRRTGAAGAVPPLPTPSDPLDSDWATYFGVYADAMRSGDVETLKSVLMNESGCGPVPAKPGDVSGPTIAQVAKRGG